MNPFLKRDDQGLELICIGSSIEMDYQREHCYDDIGGHIVGVDLVPILANICSIFLNHRE